MDESELRSAIDLARNYDRKSVNVLCEVAERVLDGDYVKKSEIPSVEILANLMQGVSVTNEDILHGNKLNTLSHEYCMKLSTETRNLLTKG